MEIEYLICKKDWEVTLREITYIQSTQEVIKTSIRDTIKFEKNKKYLVVKISSDCIAINFDENHTISFSITPSLKVLDYYLNIFYDPKYNEYELVSEQLDNMPIEFIEKYLRIKKLKNLN